MSDSVESIYQRLAPVYDLIYGITLAPGRRRAMRRLAPKGGESILEIGVGTGLSAMQYPDGCRVVAIDISPHMLGRAKRRLRRRGVDHVSLCRMDGTRLAFADGSFDAVYAPYVVNVVDDPLELAREMVRVCRPHGRIVLLNHFGDAEGEPSAWDRMLGRVVSRVGGVNWSVDLDRFLRDARLVARSHERVNLPRVSSVVVCTKA